MADLTVEEVRKMFSLHESEEHEVHSNGDQTDLEIYSTNIGRLCIAQAEQLAEAENIFREMLNELALSNVAVCEEMRARAWLAQRGKEEK